MHQDASIPTNTTLDSETPEASFKACLAQRDNSDMNTEDILTDPRYEAVPKSTLSQGGAVVQAEATTSAAAVGAPPLPEATAPRGGQG